MIEVEIEEATRKYIELIKERMKLLNEYVTKAFRKRDWDRMRTIKESVKRIDESIKQLHRYLEERQKERMEKFLEEYGKLCMKYLIFVNAEAENEGDECMTYEYLDDALSYILNPNPEDVIKVHIEILKKSIEKEQR